jgi:hypothetical protein
MSIKDVATNINRRGLKDILSKDTRKAYWDYEQIEEQGLLLDVAEIVPYTEQLMYRLTKCSRCVDAGKCNGYDGKGCGCPTPAKMISPTASCPEKRWDKMMEPEEWANYKKERNITIEVFEP